MQPPGQRRPAVHLLGRDLERKAEPNLFTLTKKIHRQVAKQKDPESTFRRRGVEQPGTRVPGVGLHLELGAELRRLPGVHQCVSSPRLNVNINHSVADASLAFMDNLFFNVMPRQDALCGQRLRHDRAVPGVQRNTLRQCADRRRQFLEYFTAGTLIGECLLSRDCPDAHVTAYVRPGKALPLVLNQSHRRPVPFQCNLAAWINSPSGRYRVDAYHMDGHLLKTAKRPNSGAMSHRKRWTETGSPSTKITAK